MLSTPLQQLLGPFHKGIANTNVTFCYHWGKRFNNFKEEASNVHQICINCLNGLYWQSGYSGCKYCDSTQFMTK